MSELRREIWSCQMDSAFAAVSKLLRKQLHSVHLQRAIAGNADHRIRLSIPANSASSALSAQAALDFAVDAADEPSGLDRCPCAKWRSNHAEELALRAVVVATSSLAHRRRAAVPRTWRKRLRQPAVASGNACGYACDACDPCGQWLRLRRPVRQAAPRHRVMKGWRPIQLRLQRQLQVPGAAALHLSLAGHVAAPADDRLPQPVASRRSSPTSMKSAGRMGVDGGYGATATGLGFPSRVADGKRASRRSADTWKR